MNLQTDRLSSRVGALDFLLTQIVVALQLTDAQVARMESAYRDLAAWLEHPDSPLSAYGAVVRCSLPRSDRGALPREGPTSSFGLGRRSEDSPPEDRPAREARPGRGVRRSGRRTAFDLADDPRGEGVPR